MNPDLKRFGSYCDHESSQFSKDSTCFHESNESLRILSTMARNKSLKIEIRESESLRILRFVSWIRFGKKISQITRFVSFRKDSYTNPASLLRTRKENSMANTIPISMICVYQKAFTALLSLYEILNNTKLYSTGK